MWPVCRFPGQAQKPSDSRYLWFLWQLDIIIIITVLPLSRHCNNSLADNSLWCMALVSMLSGTYITPVLLMSMIRQSSSQWLHNGNFYMTRFSPDISQIFSKIPVISWQVSKSPIFPGFPDKWSPITIIITIIIDIIIFINTDSI